MHTCIFLLAFLAVCCVEAVPTIPNYNEQCRMHNHVGVCGENRFRFWASRCRNVICASRSMINFQHVPQSIGPARPGTLCGISRVCNARHECVPVLNVPRQAGSTEFYHCAR